MAVPDLDIAVIIGVDIQTASGLGGIRGPCNVEGLIDHIVTPFLIIKSIITGPTKSAIAIGGVGMSAQA